ncbi:MAG: hypothetical protein JST30_03920 [Armatimonadetes bacterium]|nr:hypothetical protein [Armatimonadota bacterium]
MKLNEDILRLRAEGSSPEAKGRVVERLQEKRRRTTMTIIGKLSIPAALVAAVAIGGMLSVPRTALASPATVAKAIRDVKNYVIDSFTMVGGKRTLTSKTTVTNGKLSRQFYDALGAPIAEGKVNALDGKLFELTIGHDANGTQRIRKSEGGPGADVHIVTGERLDGPVKEIEVQGSPIGDAQGRSVEIKAEKGPDGKVTKKVIVDGKEVKDLPADLKDKVGVKVGKGHDVQGLHLEIGSAIKSGEVVRGGMLVIEGNHNGDVTSFASGQTSVDYLLKLLDDQTRWNIDRGVTVNGQKLDKFTLKGPASPIELFVDPMTSLPRLLRFVGPGVGDHPQVEDEYVYGAVPPVK